MKLTVPSFVASSHLFWYFIDSSGSNDFNNPSYFSSASVINFACGNENIQI